MTLAFTNLSPGTYLREENLSARLRNNLSLAGGMVYESRRGPTDLTFYPNGRRFLELNGKADPSISHGHDCFLAFLDESANGWAKRVTNGALYAGTTYLVDRRSKYAPAAVNGKYAGRTLHYDFQVGSETGYADGLPDVTLITFADMLVTGNAFQMDITDGEDVETVNVTFSSNHNTTIQNIAAAVNVALSSFGSGGISQVMTEPVSGSDSYVIFIRNPIGTTLLFNTPTITGGTTQTTVYADPQARLFDVFAENPGDWANDVGVKLTGFDQGTRQRFRLTLSNPLVSLNSFTCNINGRSIGPVVFATDSDNTMEMIAATIQSDIDIDTAEVQVVPGARNNDRSIDIVVKPAYPGAVTISGGVVTGGVSQPSVLIRETLRGVASTGEFSLEVYERPNTSLFVESFRVTLGKRVDNRNRQQQIDKMVNSSVGSTRVRIAIPDYARDYVFQPELYLGSYVIDKTINWLNGGDLGVAAMNSQIREGWQAFRNRQRVPANLLINAGYTDPSVQQEMVALAEYRYDAFAVLDMPTEQQGTQAAFNYRMQTMNIDSSYGAIYTPDLLVQDDDSDEQRYIPPSGHVAAAYAYTQRTAAIWFAPAGIQRGKLRRVQGLRVDYELQDRELLSPNGVNCIIDRDGVGPVIWDEVTLSMSQSVLSGVHARLLANWIEVSYADGLDYVALFEPNNVATQYKAEQVGRKLLQPIKDKGGLYDFEVVTDSRINTDEVVEDEMMLVDVYLDIVRTAKRIVITGILTPKGAKFAELIVQRGARR